MNGRDSTPYSHFLEFRASLHRWVVDERAPLGTDIAGGNEGSIESRDNTITIGLNGRVQGNIRACHVIIPGQVQGNIEASDKVDLRKDSKLIGDVTASRISVEDGAYFKGRIDTEMPETNRRSAAAPA